MSGFYTYPVLGIDGHFESHQFSMSLKSYELSQEKREYGFEFEYQLDEPTVMAHVTSSNATVCIQVRNKAFYYEVFRFKNQLLKIVIPFESIGDNFSFEFRPYILVSNRINGYVNPNADTVRSKYFYNLVKGNLLAVAPTIRLSFEQDFLIDTGANSILKIKKKDGYKGNPKLELKPHKIYLVLSEGDYDEVLSLYGSSAKKAILGNIFFPVFLEIFWSIKTNEISHEEYEWIDSLSHLVDFMNQEPFESAQELLNNPIFKSSEVINKMLEDE